ncbi:MAG: class I SAM-dependent methyltransferase [Porticoccaceae bacterium]
MENLHDPKTLDNGAAFDWGRTSESYARYRDVYPEAFYRKMQALGLATPGQQVLDLGTGTGVLPRNLAGCGARFVGVDAAAPQIEQARRLSAEAGLDIEYRVCAAEDIDFEDDRFDAVTACQCFHYFDTQRLMPKLHRALKDGGLLGILFMAWLPGESDIARRSEALVLRYSPQWTGGGWQRTLLQAPQNTEENGFRLVQNIAFDVPVAFTRESWNGRMKACRGVEAALAPEAVARFEAEHLALLEKTAPEAFTVPHQALMLVLQNGKAATAAGR